MTERQLLDLRSVLVLLNQQRNHLSLLSDGDCDAPDDILATVEAGLGAVSLTLQRFLEHESLRRATKGHRAQEHQGVGA
jgi:hypothetical protein